MQPPNFISKMFGASPVKPLQVHMAKVLVCVETLQPFFNAAIAQDWSEAQRIQKRIALFENEADDLKKKLRLHLPNGLMLAFSRRDLLEVLAMQDSVANKAKDIAGLMLGRKMVFPEPVALKFDVFLKRSIDATTQASKVIHELDELVETGFRGGEVELVDSLLIELDKIESDTDRMQVDIRSTLFKLETTLPPVEVMFLYKIAEWVGELADRAQRVGSRLQLMLAR
ncbi:MAG: TIGR00153 family protein [Gammaproteobacteria bacterium]|nr:TIGR00153 family protein [Gammaproteobacteria bacterium]